jgi:hypothetical protein
MPLVPDGYKGTIVGQCVPPDMVFVPGNNTIKSFYMGISEEPNINYRVYLKWLKDVFGSSYPEMVSKAVPDNSQWAKALEYNDPYVNAYFTHPAYSYYPVVGLSWVQIQNYLAWRTDRVNEQILIQTGYLDTNAHEVDLDNFNTEAFLYGQYVGWAKKVH